LLKHSAGWSFPWLSTMNSLIDHSLMGNSATGSLSLDASCQQPASRKGSRLWGDLHDMLLGDELDLALHYEDHLVSRLFSITHLGTRITI
jgi:hypothetical protein